MLTIGLYYDVMEGKEREFEEYFEAVREKVSSFKGFVSAILYRRVDMPNSYLIYSEWKDMPSFEAFIKSNEFHNVKEEGRSNLLISRPYHKIYNSP